MAMSIRQKREETCFERLASMGCNANCGNRKCSFHAKSMEKNCAILEADGDRLTLRSIGDIFGLSRMRICQIEKSIIAKLKEEVLPDLQETCDLE